ncbi:PIN domain-containing protein [bacterium]|nr:PIN domain-containing protein [bacterium]MBU1753984.1 PIN domain-containing protein [bacterium]
MNNIIDIMTYNPNKDDKFFLDANIWMYLFCPIGDYGKDTVTKYSAFLKKAIQSKSPIFISSLVLSEFFNAYVRLEFNILKSNAPLRYQDFKRDFRKTDDYQRLMVDIKTTVKTQILKVSKRVDDNFSNMNLEGLFDNIDQSDFNDNYYLTMANLEKFKIVTNDYDFAFSRATSVPILTANKKMLKEA